MSALLICLVSTTSKPDTEVPCSYGAMQQLKLPELLLYVCGNVISNAGLYVHVIKFYIP